MLDFCVIKIYYYYFISMLCLVCFVIAIDFYSRMRNMLGNRIGYQVRRTVIQKRFNGVKETSRKRHPDVCSIGLTYGAMPIVQIRPFSEIGFSKLTQKNSVDKRRFSNVDWFKSPENLKTLKYDIESIGMRLDALDYNVISDVEVNGIKPLFLKLTNSFLLLREAAANDAVNIRDLNSVRSNCELLIKRLPYIHPEFQTDILSSLVQGYELLATHPQFELKLSNKEDSDFLKMSELKLTTFIKNNDLEFTDRFYTSRLYWSLKLLDSATLLDQIKREEVLNRNIVYVDLLLPIMKNLFIKQKDAEDVYDFLLKMERNLSELKPSAETQERMISDVSGEDSLNDETINVLKDLKEGLECVKDIAFEGVKDVFSVVGVFPGTLTLGRLFYIALSRINDSFIKNGIFYTQKKLLTEINSYMKELPTRNTPSQIKMFSGPVFKNPSLELVAQRFLAHQVSQYSAEGVHLLGQRLLAWNREQGHCFSFDFPKRLEKFRTINTIYVNPSHKEVLMHGLQILSDLSLSSIDPIIRTEARHVMQRVSDNISRGSFRDITNEFLEFKTLSKRLHKSLSAYMIDESKSEAIVTLLHDDACMSEKTKQSIQAAWDDMDAGCFNKAWDRLHVVLGTDNLNGNSDNLELQLGRIALCRAAMVLARKEEIFGGRSPSLFCMESTKVFSLADPEWEDLFTKALELHSTKGIHDSLPAWRTLRAELDKFCTTDMPDTPKTTRMKILLENYFDNDVPHNSESLISSLIDESFSVFKLTLKKMDMKFSLKRMLIAQFNRIKEGYSVKATNEFHAISKTLHNSSSAMKILEKLETINSAVHDGLHKTKGQHKQLELVNTIKVYLGMDTLPETTREWHPELFPLVHNLLLFISMEDDSEMGAPVLTLEGIVRGFYTPQNSTLFQAGIADETKKEAWLAQSLISKLEELDMADPEESIRLTNLSRLLISNAPLSFVSLANLKGFRLLYMHEHLADDNSSELIKHVEFTTSYITEQVLNGRFNELKDRCLKGRDELSRGREPSINGMLVLNIRKAIESIEKDIRHHLYSCISTNATQSGVLPYEQLKCLEEKPTLEACHHVYEAMKLSTTVSQSRLMILGLMLESIAEGTPLNAPIAMHYVDAIDKNHMHQCDAFLLKQMVNRMDYLANHSLKHRRDIKSKSFKKYKKSIFEFAVNNPRYNWLKLEMNHELLRFSSDLILENFIWQEAQTVSLSDSYRLNMIVDSLLYFSQYYLDISSSASSDQILRDESKDKAIVYKDKIKFLLDENKHGFKLSDKQKIEYVYLSLLETALLNDNSNSKKTLKELFEIINYKDIRENKSILIDLKFQSLTEKINDKIDDELYNNDRYIDAGSGENVEDSDELEMYRAAGACRLIDYSLKTLDKDSVLYKDLIQLRSKICEEYDYEF